MRVMKGKYCARISHLDRGAWNGCFPGDAEAHEYYSACELAERSPRMGAACVSLDGRIVAVAPVFSMQFSLASSFQPEAGSLARVLRAVASCIRFPIVCVGSPYAERCHIGLRPGLTGTERRAVLRLLMETVERRATGTGVGLMAVKDVSGGAADEVPALLAEQGYARLSSLPVASLDLSGIRNVENYLATLSAGTRRDLRRKLRSASGVRVEDRHDIADVAAEITHLYESVREASRFDYGELEELPAEFFLQVSHQLGERALFRLYWVGETLAAFNLLLLEPDRVIDKFLGMRYPLAREHNLYALSWIENVRLCLARGVRTLQTGQTAYREKIRLGSRLVPSSVWFRHRNPAIHRLLRAVAPLGSFDRNDPELRGVLRGVTQ
jgi:hypothetical protein